MTRNESNSESDVLVRKKEKTDEPSMYKVILLNDDYSTMEFVVMILETVFSKTRPQAETVMLAVHSNGSGVAGVYTKEIAETKISSVRALARQNEFPLRCRLEPT